MALVVVLGAELACVGVAAACARCALVCGHDELGACAGMLLAGLAAKRAPVERWARACRALLTAPALPAGRRA
jgi:hypothetical protein